MKRYLTCLFSYNRPTLLANAVDSIDRFFPWGDRLVIDDGSSDPGVARYLESVARRPNWRVTVADHIEGRWYGGFWRNTRYALELALQEGYDYGFFFEDDQQLVWKKEDYPEYVEKLFSTCPDAIQVATLFQRRFLSYANSTEYIASVRAYRTTRGFISVAIWNLEAVRAHPGFFKYADEEPTNSAYWLRQGYRVYQQFDPTVAIIPWVTSNRRPDSASSDERFRKSNASSDFLLKPLSSAEIDFLQTRSPALPAYQEYFGLSPENCERPIWNAYGENLNRYYFLCRKVVDGEDRSGQSPVPVPMLVEWAPTSLPPEMTHMKARTGLSMFRPRWDSLVPEMLKPLRRKVAAWRRFNVRDYLGYRELTRRLQEERQNLPFHSARTPRPGVT